MNFEEIVKYLEMSSSKVVYEGWMVRYGRRKIGRSFIHMRYFVLESRLLAYYKKKPQDSVVIAFSVYFVSIFSPYIKCSHVEIGDRGFIWLIFSFITIIGEHFSELCWYCYQIMQFKWKREIIGYRRYVYKL